MPRPCVTIYRNKLKGNFLVQRSVPSHDGGSIESGEPIFVRAEDFDRTIVGLVVDCFDFYTKTAYDPDLVTKRPGKEGLDFAKQHLQITLWLSSTGEIEIYAWERYRGIEHKVVRDSKAIVKADPVDKGLPQAIREAFSKAN